MRLIVKPEAQAQAKIELLLVCHSKGRSRPDAGLERAPEFVEFVEHPRPARAVYSESEICDSGSNLEVRIRQASHRVQLRASTIVALCTSPAGCHAGNNGGGDPTSSGFYRSGRQKSELAMYFQGRGIH